MKLCRVIIPFTDKYTGDQYKMDDEVVFSDERIAEIKALNVNMILVIGDAPKKRKKKD